MTEFTLAQRLGLGAPGGAGRASIRETVLGSATLSAPYLVMNAAATLIAGYGLLADSVAVVIGAMLIAMLYGPILGIAFALAEADTRLLGRAIVAEVVGVLWVLSIGFTLGWINADVPIGEQVLARTAPNVLDLMIALVGGIAGAYATVSPRVSSAVVGVAIATALCPPMTACGILLAHGLPHLAEGAFLLFLANFAAIAVGAMLVFLLAGHRGVLAGGRHSATWLARLAPVVLFLALAFHLVSVFRASLADTNLRSGTEKALEQALEAHPGARLVEVRIGGDGRPRIAFAVVRTPNGLTPADVARLDAAVDRATGRDLSLHVRVVRVEELTAEGPLYVREPTAERARSGR
jgi:uncharacterized hydrophobic protein (TIGR00271 family)